MIRFLKMLKKDFIKKKLYKLEIKSARYLELSKAEQKNAESFKRMIDLHLNLAKPGNKHYIMHQRELHLNLEEWSQKYSKHIAVSSEYKAMYDNLQQQISELTSKAIELSVKK